MPKVAGILTRPCFDQTIFRPSPFKFLNTDPSPYLTRRYVTICQHARGKVFLPPLTRRFLILEVNKVKINSI